MRTLLIDDLRTLPVDKIARTFDEGIESLRNGPWDILYLDHDLGDPTYPEKTGYTIMCWLESNPEFLPRKIELVTSNPVGRQNMMQVIRRLYSR